MQSEFLQGHMDWGLSIPGKLGFPNSNNKKSLRTVDTGSNVTAPIATFVRTKRGGDLGKEMRSFFRFLPSSNQNQNFSIRNDDRDEYSDKETHFFNISSETKLF